MIHTHSDIDSGPSMDYAFVNNEVMAFNAPPYEPLSEPLPGSMYVGTPPVTPFEWSPPPEYTGNPLGILPMRNPSYDEAISQMNRVERKTEQLEVCCVCFTPVSHKSILPCIFKAITQSSGHTSAMSTKASKGAAGLQGCCNPQSFFAAIVVTIAPSFSSKPSAQLVSSRSCCDLLYAHG